MSTTNKAEHHKRAKVKFERHHSEGYKKFAAKKKMAKLEKKRIKNVKRGRVGHAVRQPKILN